MSHSSQSFFAAVAAAHLSLLLLVVAFSPSASSFRPTQHYYRNDAGRQISPAPVPAPAFLSASRTQRTALFDAAPGDSDNGNGASSDSGDGKRKKRKKKKPPSGGDSSSSNSRRLSEDKKRELLKAVGEEMRSNRNRRRGQEGGGTGQRQEQEQQRRKEGQQSDKDEVEGEEERKPSLFDALNPFKAGQNLRKTIDDQFSSIALSQERKSMYYLGDRLADISPVGSSSSSSSSSFTDRNPLLDRLEEDEFVPEVLVVGATGEVGRLVVRRLLLEGKCRVRVLVRNLYTQTLNLFGAGVTYAQGDLGNEASLEVALTDVDKIVFCASAPRPDEDQFKQRFKEYTKETLDGEDATAGGGIGTELPTDTTKSNREWEQLASILEVRAKLAEQVDCIGVQNLVRAYQNVRHADYGTSQAAKRSLFKFQDRPEDFNLFAIDEEDEDGGAESAPSQTTSSTTGKSSQSVDGAYDEDTEPEDFDYDADYSDYEYEDDDEDYYDDAVSVGLEERRDASVKTQTQWIRNQFGHGVFVGKVPKASKAGGVAGGEAAIVSSRLRSRDDPDSGIDLSAGFGGFICRVCADGGTYEAFVRTKEYYENGIEYVCDFSTATKPSSEKNKSSNKFVTVRLPFESFKPVRRRNINGASTIDSVPPFRGKDVRNLGFRYRSASNSFSSRLRSGDWNSFYLALCYIKLYRNQPEPEIVYLSDARIPPVIRNGMVRHDARQLVVSGNGGATRGPESGGVRILDESTLQSTRSQEETYYKYRGEEIIKTSGLSYAIVRVSSYNESPSGEASTIDLKVDNNDLAPVSRAEVAQVVQRALMDPNALNKVFYVSKKLGRRGSPDDDLSSKFASLPQEVVV